MREVYARNEILHEGSSPKRSGFNRVPMRAGLPRTRDDAVISMKNRTDFLSSPLS